MASTGTVRWFSDKKGFGFIARDDVKNNDVFVHYAEIEMEGRKVLRQGQEVEFQLRRGPKGLYASNVVPLN